MSRRLGVIMDPIAAIKPKKDTTLALLLAAARHGYELHYMEMSDLSLRDGRACARTRPLTVHNDLAHWYDFTLWIGFAAILASFALGNLRKVPLVPERDPRLLESLHFTNI